MRWSSIYEKQRIANLILHSNILSPLILLDVQQISNLQPLLFFDYVLYSLYNYSFDEEQQNVKEEENVVASDPISQKFPHRNTS